MKKIILGFLLGLVIGTAITVFSMPGNRQGREYDKFVASSNGETCVLISVEE